MGVAEGGGEATQPHKSCREVYEIEVDGVALSGRSSGAGRRSCWVIKLVGAIVVIYGVIFSGIDYANDRSNSTIYAYTHFVPFYLCVVWSNKGMYTVILYS